MIIKEDFKTKLDLNIENKYGKTVVEDCYYTEPLKILTPRCSDRLRVVLMMASSGILKGDSFLYNINCGEKTKTEITSQSYEKIFDTLGDIIEKKVIINLASDAELLYNPTPVIPFENSSFNSYTEVHLNENSRFLCTEILSGGRVGMGEIFKFKLFHTNLVIKINNIPIFIEQSYYEPSKMQMNSFFNFNNFTHQGNLFIYQGMNFSYESLKEQIYQKINYYCSYYKLTLDEDLVIGISDAEYGLAIKIIALQSQIIEEIFKKIIELI